MKHWLVGFLLIVGLLGCSKTDPSSSPYLRHTGPTPILVYGDSLSAGYGMTKEQAWPTLMEQQLKSEGYLRQDQTIANYSKSDETTSGGLQRFEQALEETQPLVVVLELGANDALRRQSMSEMRQNLDRMIGMAKTRNIDVILVGVDLPSKFFFVNTKHFTTSYEELAQKHNLRLVPNLLKGVNNTSSLMMDDGLHPNSLGQPKIVENMWDVLTEAQ